MCPSGLDPLDDVARAGSRVMPDPGGNEFAFQALADRARGAIQHDDPLGPGLAARS